MAWQQQSNWNSDTGTMDTVWYNTATGETSATKPPDSIAGGNGFTVLNPDVRESSIGLNGALTQGKDGYYVNGQLNPSVTASMIPGLVSGASTRQQQAIEHNQKDHTTELAALAGFAGLGALGASGAGGLLGDTASSSLIAPETSSQLAANAGGASLAPGTVTLNGALEAAVGNAGQMSLVPGSLAPAAAAASATPSFMSSLPALQAANAGASLLSPAAPASAPASTVAPPQQAPAPVTDANISPVDPMSKLTDWIKANPLQAASLGLTAASVLGKVGAKLTPEDTYQAPAIDQSVVNKYGHIPTGLLQAGGDPNYQGFTSIGTPSGLLQMRLNKMRGIL